MNNRTHKYPVILSLLVAFFTPELAAAQSVSTSAPASWVSLTTLLLGVVVVSWILFALGFRLASQAHLIPTYRKFEIRRSMQITFGTLFLMAGTMPYLALHYPFALMGVIAVVAIAASILSREKNRSLHSQVR